MKFALLALALSLPAYAALPSPGQPGAVNDPRYCGEPERHANGVIKRDASLLRDFAKVFPCPSTLQPVPSCPGWQIDHVLPLASGGCAMQGNLQWLPVEIKTCAGTLCKDRWDRIYHAIPRKAVKGM